MRLPMPALLATLLLAACAGDFPGADPSDGGDGAAASQRDRPGSGTGAGVPDTLQGLDVQEVAGLLGPSSFRRTDGPSEMLQYRNQVCVLDIFVYRDADGDAGRVRHAEARDHQLGQMPEAECLKALIRSKRT